MLLFKW